VGAKTISYLGDNTTHQIYGQGNVSIQLNSSQNIKDIINVLHISRIYLFILVCKTARPSWRENQTKASQFTLKICKRNVIVISIHYYKNEL
jgi:hypothetical protein